MPAKLARFGSQVLGNLANELAVALVARRLQRGAALVEGDRPSLNRERDARIRRWNEAVVVVATAEQLILERPDLG
jgi:hypothetical protein